MKKTKGILKILIIAISCYFLLFTFNSSAEELGIAFEVAPKHPTTQIDRTRGYYYIETKPGEKQSVDLEIFSTTDRELTLEMSVENAYSATTGNIDYSNDLELLHESLVNPITEIVTFPSEIVTLKPKGSKVVSFDLNPPADHYDGVKMGRIIIKEKSDDNSKGITQEYRYALGVITSESGLAYNDGNTLELEKVQANINLGNKVVEGYIVNPQPKTIENLEVRSYVTKKGSTKKVKERNIDNFSFAPNSRLVYTIPWGLSEFQSGEYTFHFEATNDFEKFNLVQNFVIRGEDARKLNKDAAFSVTTPNIMKIIIITLNTILIILFVVIIARDKKWIKEIKTKRRSRNRGSKRNRKKTE